MKTATEGQEGSQRRGRCLHLQRDHRQRGWSLNREALALHVQRVTHVSSTSSGVTHRSGGLADQKLRLEETVWDHEQLVSGHRGRGGIWVRVAPEEGLRWCSGCQHQSERGGLLLRHTAVATPEAPLFPWHLILKWKACGLPSKYWKQMQNKSVER